MTGIDFLLGAAASLLATAVDRLLVERPGQWTRRRIDRRIESMTDAVMQPMVEYFEREKINEETTILVAKEAEKPVRALIQSSDEMIARGLDVDAIVTYILEKKLDENARQIAAEYPAAFDTMLRAYVDLAVRTPPLFADWEQKQFSATHTKLTEMEEYLARMYGDMRKVSERHERGETLIDRIIAHQAGRLALKMNLQGLRTAELPQTDIDNLFILPYFSKRKDDNFERLNAAELKDAFAPGRTGARNVVVAPAGAGKTTWVEWLGSELLNDEMVSSLPVNIRLRQAMKAPALPTLIEAVQEVISPAFHDKFGPRDVENWVIKGKLYLLLDGYDEVPERDRDRVFSWIEGLVAADPSLNVVVTSRPLTTKHIKLFAEDGWVNFLLESFDEAQVESYIEKYQKYGPPIQTGAQELSPAELAKTWRNDPSLGPLTANPLLLSTLLAVHHMDGELPQGRTALYERYVDGMLGAWESRKELTPPDVALTKPNKRKILEALAINMIANEVDAVDENEAAIWIGPYLDKIGVKASVRGVLEHLRERSGLLIGPGQYSFAHKSIGEFLVACACNDGIARDVDGQRYDRMLLTRKSHEDRWLMVAFLWAGLAPATDVQLLIEEKIRTDELGLAEGLLVDHGERLDPERRAELCWKFLTRLNHLRVSHDGEAKDGFHLARYFNKPLKNAVTNTQPSLEPVSRRPSGGMFGEGYRHFYRKGWIDLKDWQQHFDQISFGVFLSLIGELGADNEFLENTFPKVTVEEQVTWLSFLTLKSRFNRPALPASFDYQCLEESPDGVWRGIAMFAAWHASDRFLEETRSPDFNLPVFEVQEALPSEVVCSDLCELQFDKECTWFNQIGAFLEAHADKKEEIGQVYFAVQKLADGCLAISQAPE